MELLQLKYAEAVARHRHFRRAAEELHVAQSALSQQIRRLEAELGTELLERTSRSVVPTEAGEAFGRARSILAEVDGVRGEIDQLRGLVRGRVSVGALLPTGPVDVPRRLLAQFAQAFPGLEVGLREGTAGDMLRYLAADEVGAAFTLRRPSCLPARRGPPAPARGAAIRGTRLAQGPPSDPAARAFIDFR